MLEVPREEFVPAERRALAYIDEDIADRTGAGRPSRPYPDGGFAAWPSCLQLAADSTRVRYRARCRLRHRLQRRPCCRDWPGSVIALESDPFPCRSAPTKGWRALGCDNVAVVQGELNRGYARRGAL
jgi:protein-L-isoaspartate(D-aspartate) O-methyltransferase